MPKLSNLVNTNLNSETISIQGVQIPIMFAMETFNYVQQAYGKSYKIFENDLNKMLGKEGKVNVGTKEMKIMYSLIYGMVRSGGTECTLQEIRGSIKVTELQDIFQKVLDIFNEQDFQQKDIDRLRQNKSKK